MIGHIYAFCRNRYQVLKLVDLLQLLVLSALALLQLLLWRRVPASHFLIFVYVGAMFMLIVVASVARQQNGSFLYDLVLPTVILLVVYETIGYSIPAVNTTWFEPWLVAFDQKVFGTVASSYLQRFHSRILVDSLHFFYVVYYLFPVSLLIFMYARAARGAQRARAQFDEAVITIGLNFYFCFLLYFVFPVLGPHRNPLVSADFREHILASGGALTRYVRVFIDNAELTVYDCFPSLHTATTLLTVLLAFRYRLAIRMYYVAPAVLVIVSTMFLGYHYLLDVVAGAVIGLAAYGLSGWWRLRLTTS
jgi:membrane-associated phospholipid phosphatase